MKYYKLILLFSCLLFSLTNLQSAVLADSSIDLQGVSLSVSPAEPQVNQTCTVKASFLNNGSDFTLNFPLKYSTSFDGFVVDAPVSITPGQDSVVKTNEYINIFFVGYFNKLRENNLSVTVDLTGYLSETNVNNNSVSNKVNVAGNELIAESISLVPTSPAVNQASHISIKIKNDGTYNLFSSTGLIPSYSFPDFVISKSESTNPDLANIIRPGDYILYDYDGKFTQTGEKQLTFTIDPNDDLKQSNKSNNTLNLKVSVSPASTLDLAVESISLNSDKIIIGNPLEITINIKNSGKVSLIDPSGFSSSDILPNFPSFVYDINTVTHDDYPTQASPFNPEAIFHYKYSGQFNQFGTFNLTFSLDKNNQLVEASETNNSSSTKVVVYQDEKSADEFSILNNNIFQVSSTSIMVNWTTSANTTGSLNYGQTQSTLYDYKIDSNENKTEHSLTITGLKSGNSYNYLITGYRGTVNKTSQVSSFTTPADDQLKITSGPVVTTSSENKTAKITWSTNLISTGFIYYKKKEIAGYTSAGSSSYSAGHQVNLNDLDIGQYDYYLISTSTPGTYLKTSLAGFELTQTPTTTPVSNENNITNTSNISASILKVENKSLYSKLKGKIILKVESKGEAYYINPRDEVLNFLGKPDDAFRVIREQGIGITNSNLTKIPLGLSSLSGNDSDNDGLPDTFEQAIGTDKNKSDSDSDGYNDKDELFKNYSPTAPNKSLIFDKNFSTSLSGKILLQVQSKGEAWYVNPADNKRYFLSRPADAFNIMRNLGLGISNKDFELLSK